MKKNVQIEIGEYAEVIYLLLYKVIGEILIFINYAHFFDHDLPK